MEAVHATLQLDIQEGRSLNAIDAGQSLIAWATALQEASIIIDPTSPMTVDLIGTEAACVRLHALLRFIEHKFFDKADNALSPYPKIRAALALNVFNMPGAIVAGAAGGIIATAIYSGHSDHVEKAATRAQDRLAHSATVQRQVRRFYETVDRAPAIKGISIYEHDPRKPIVVVPRSQFPERSGLWLPQEVDGATRPQSGIWDVIVTHPAAIGKPRVWRFKRDGLPFKAKMIDPFFLAAIRERTLPLQVHEGTLMRLKVDWIERLAGDEWVADDRSYVVTKVVWPTPLSVPAATPLFPESGSATGDEDDSASGG